MQHAAQTYGAVAKQTANPRELEADLLLTQPPAYRRSMIDGTPSRPELDAALVHNRSFYFVTSATSPEIRCRRVFRQNVANLGLFVFNHTLAIMANPKPESLGSLININRELAAGLLVNAPHSAHPGIYKPKRPRLIRGLFCFDGFRAARTPIRLT